MPNREKKIRLFFIVPTKWGVVDIFIFSILVLIKLMQWLQSHLQPKGPGFEPFLKLSLSSTNKMDENKFSKYN
jgi:hypothetical protein